MDAFVPAFNQWLKVEPVQTGVVRLVDDDHPMYYIESYKSGQGWSPLLDHHTHKPIEFGRLDLAIGVAKSRAVEIGIPHRVKSKPSELPPS